MTQTGITLDSGHLPNTCQYIAKSARGDYLIQVAWPLCWSEGRTPPENDFPLSILYLVDGNAYFFTAVDITRRLEFTHNTRTIVVGVGYPNTECVYDWRRGPDLTPPTPDGKYEYPVDRDGNPRTDLSFGEADKFLDFIHSDVITYVETTLFPHASLPTARKALYGHSYGGIFSLTALYTKTTLFDMYISASPTIFWSNYALVKNQEADFLKRTPPANPPSLVLTWGTGVDELERRPGESDDAWEKRKGIAEDKLMKGSALDLIERLKRCAGVRDVWSWEFPGEDHGSAAVVGLQRGIMTFLIDTA